MEKLKMHSPNLTQENIHRIMELFPNCVTEVRATTENTESTEKDNSNHSKSSVVKYAIDFDLLRQELSESIVEGPQERYHLNWPGKREALLTANAPIAKTLRPCREESVDFDTTKNLFIEGDNLDALKLLQETYLGKVKMIYIDPPYNTGNDFIYEDDFAENAEEFLKRSNQKDEEGNRLMANTEANGRFHSDWLSMIFPRIKLAKNLLADDGLLFVSIDEIECANLRKICDEVFGEDNFFAELVWKNKTGGGAKTKGWISLHEYILCYARNKNSIIDISIPYSEKTASMYNKKDEKYSIRGPYATWPLDTTSMGDRPNLRFPIEYNGIEIWPEKQWLWSKERVQKAISENLLEFNLQKDNTYKVRFKGYLKDEHGVIRRGSPLSIMDGPYSQEGSKDFQQLLPKAIFPFPKPISLLTQLFSISTSDSPRDEEIVMDFFCGSGSTAHSLFKINAQDGGNRKFIMVQLPEPCDEKSEAFKAGYKTIAEISKERIRRAGKKILEELTTESTEKHGKSKNKFSGETNSSVSSVPSVVKNPDIGFLEGLTTESTEKQGKGEDDSFSSSSVNSVPSVVKNLDIGFRVLKVDSSNMADVYYTPDAIEQGQLEVFVNNIKPDRTPEDLLFQVLLDWGVDLSLPIRKESVTTANIEHSEKDNNKNSVLSVSSVVKKSFEVFFVDNNALIACFDDGITEELVKELAQFKPLRVVFCDTRYQSDNDKINVTQIFKQLSPGTEVKAI